MHFRRLSGKRRLQPIGEAEYPISKKMGRIRCFAVEMARRGRAGGITNLRFLVRPRRLETRTERGFPHFPSNGGYCSLAHLKRQTRQNRGVRQILAQNRKTRDSGDRVSAVVVAGMDCSETESATPEWVAGAQGE